MTLESKIKQLTVQFDSAVVNYDRRALKRFATVYTFEPLALIPKIQ